MPVSRHTPGPSIPSRNLSKAVLLATDLQKSVLIQLDRTGPGRVAYSPYGSQDNLRPAGTRLGFNGELKEQPAGWYHLGNGHRVYNPALMRFHSPDRLSPFAKGGWNAYAYCKGDPVNFVDPTGQFIQAAVAVFERIVPFIKSFETVSAHASNITRIAFNSLPRGVMGYATLASNVGYGGVATGATMQALGYSTGAVVSNVGGALMSLGNGIRMTHTAINTAATSRIGGAIARRFMRKEAPVLKQGEIVVANSGTGTKPSRRSNARRHRLPSSVKTDAVRIRQKK